MPERHNYICLFDMKLDLILLRGNFFSKAKFHNNKFKANKSLFVLGSLRKEGMSQEEVDHLFNAIVLPNFSYALPVYDASDSDLSVIQNFLDRCMKRKFMSKNVNIRDLLEKADKTLYKKRSNDPECPFFQFLPREKNTRYNLRNTSASVPRIYTDRFKNVFSNRIIFRYDM